VAWAKVKTTNMTRRGQRADRWTTRAFCKDSAKRRRRTEDKTRIEEQR
jgi:hypothetical protein